MFTMRIQGGSKSSIYCGSNVKVPKGKIRGRPIQCFIAGRKSGFYAGLLKAQQTKQADLPIGQDLSIGELRGILVRHLRANPTLPKSYLATSGSKVGRMVNQGDLTKPDYIAILRQYRLVR
jgi:hypothetical protein